MNEQHIYAAPSPFDIYKLLSLTEIIFAAALFLFFFTFFFYYLSIDMDTTISCLHHFWNLLLIYCKLVDLFVIMCMFEFMQDEFAGLPAIVPEGPIAILGLVILLVLWCIIIAIV